MPQAPPGRRSNFHKKPQQSGDNESSFGVSKHLAKSDLDEVIHTGRIQLTYSRLKASKSHTNAPVKDSSKTLYVPSKSTIHFGQDTSSLTPRNLSLESTGNQGIGTPTRYPATPAFSTSQESTRSKRRPSMTRARNRLVVNQTRRSQLQRQSLRIHRGLWPSDLLRILTYVDEDPGTIAKTRRNLTISAAELKRLVQGGVLKESWGKGGVGVTIRLSQKGLRQLRWMQEASKLATQNRRSLIINLKHSALPV